MGFLLNQTTKHWDTTMGRWTMLLPPGVGEGWDGGADACGMLPGSHPHPRPPPSQGEGRCAPCADTVAPEGSLCANHIWSDLDILGQQRLHGLKRDLLMKRNLANIL